MPLCDIHVNSCFVWQAHASFSEFELHFSWQAWHFGDLHRHFAWQAQHLRRVVLRFFVGIAWSGLREVVTTCKFCCRRGTS